MKGCALGFIEELKVKDKKTMAQIVAARLH